MFLNRINCKARNPVAASYRAGTSFVKTVLSAAARAVLLLALPAPLMPQSVRKCCEVGTEGAGNLTADYQAAIGTPNRPAMNAACPRMSFFGNHRICPLRIM